MSIDWQHFTPWSALLGGLLIGLGASLFMLANGRIAGISGMLGSLLSRAPNTSGKTEKAFFLLGIVSAALIWWVVSDMPKPQIDTSWSTLLIAGLLVGFGTSYASGCTSGHGVCGLARLSPRSLVATLSFMGAGFGCVYLMRHVLGA